MSKPKTFRYAYCYASGMIKFGNTVPEGALQIACGPGRELRSIVSGIARETRPKNPGGKTWLLVPGIPEAENDVKKLDALLAFIGYVGLRLVDCPIWLALQDDSAKMRLIKTALTRFQNQVRQRDPQASQRLVRVLNTIVNLPNL